MYSNKLICFLFIFNLFASKLFAQNYADTIAQHRVAYKAEFLTDKNSPLKEKDLQHLHFFDADSEFKVVGNTFVLGNQKPFKMPTHDGSTSEYIRYALVSFNLDGKTFHVTLYRSLGLMTNPLYKNLLFLPFTDLTNGKTTYGGGRYIDLNIEAIDEGKITIDFNKAYNPYCAYSDGYRCPVPPEENNLSISIVAGEKAYTGDKKHH